jgi:hypothetical protein
MAYPLSTVTYGRSAATNQVPNPLYLLDEPDKYKDLDAGSMKTQPLRFEPHSDVARLRAGVLLKVVPDIPVTVASAKFPRTVLASRQRFCGPVDDLLARSTHENEYTESSTEPKRLDAEGIKN